MISINTCRVVRPLATLVCSLVFTTSAGWVTQEANMPAATPQGKLQNDGNCSVPNTAKWIQVIVELNGYSATYNYSQPSSLVYRRPGTSQRMGHPSVMLLSSLHTILAWLIFTIRYCYINSESVFLPLPPSVLHIADMACITPLYSNIPDYITHTHTSWHRVKYSRMCDEQHFHLIASLDDSKGKETNANAGSSC